MAEAAAAEGVDPATVTLVATDLKRFGRVPQALSLLRRANERSPSTFWLNLYLGEALRRGSGQAPAGAETYLRVAVALRPDSPVWPGVAWARC